MYPRAAVMGFLAFSLDSPSAAKLSALVGIAGFSYLVLRSMRAFRRLEHIPGPRVAAFTELWLLCAAWAGDFHLTAATLLHQYGQSQQSGGLHEI